MNKRTEKLKNFIIIIIVGILMIICYTIGYYNGSQLQKSMTSKEFKQFSNIRDEHYKKVVDLIEAVLIHQSKEDPDLYLFIRGLAEENSRYINQIRPFLPDSLRRRF